MEKYVGRKTLSALTSLTMLAGGSLAVAVPAIAQTTAVPLPAASVTADANAIVQSAAVKVANVQGTFAYTQDKVSSIDYIAGVFTPATKSLCGSPADSAIGRKPLPISVGGKVSNHFTATSEDMSDDSQTSVLLTCSCAANVAGGGAVVNAKVSGVSIADVAATAGVK